MRKAVVVLLSLVMVMGMAFAAMAELPDLTRNYINLLVDDAKFTFIKSTKLDNGGARAGFNMPSENVACVFDTDKNGNVISAVLIANDAVSLVSEGGAHWGGWTYSVINGNDSGVKELAVKIYKAVTNLKSCNFTHRNVAVEIKLTLKKSYIGMSRRK